MKTFSQIIISITIFSMLISLVSLSSCTFVREVFTKDKKIDITIGTVEELRLAYINGDLDALEELIAIYEDNNQPITIRVTAIRAMKESQHPLALKSLTNYVKKAEALDLEVMVASIDALGNFEGDPQASEALLESIFAIDKKLRNLQASIFKSLSNVRTEDQILALLDIYEKSRSAFYNTALMISKTLGRMDHEEVIPILVFIANDQSLDIKLRNRAIEILAQKKESTEVVDMFVDMLTDPTMEAQIRDFALRTMKDIKEERLILALLETYSQGQKSYYSLLNTLLDALGNFDDPAIIPTLIQISLDKGMPKNLRIKAIRNLANFKDPHIFKEILPVLEDRENYQYYEHITELAHKLGVSEQYKNELKEAALIAQEKALEEEKRKE